MEEGVPMILFVRNKIVDDLRTSRHSLCQNNGKYRGATEEKYGYERIMTYLICNQQLNLNCMQTFLGLEKSFIIVSHCTIM